MMYFKNFIQVEMRAQKEGRQNAGQAILQRIMISFRRSLDARIDIP